jgi:serine/threonine protein kinase
MCLARQLLEGVYYMHKRRILHRDMKAANILVNRNGILKVADFGLARVLASEPQPGAAEREIKYTPTVCTVRAFVGIFIFSFLSLDTSHLVFSRCLNSAGIGRPRFC